jgi:hypothetical protein
MHRQNFSHTEFTAVKVIRFYCGVIVHFLFSAQQAVASLRAHRQGVGTMIAEKHLEGVMGQLEQMLLANRRESHFEGK